MKKLALLSIIVLAACGGGGEKAKDGNVDYAGIWKQNNEDGGVAYVNIAKGEKNDYNVSWYAVKYNEDAKVFIIDKDTVAVLDSLKPSKSFPYNKNTDGTLTKSGGGSTIKMEGEYLVWQGKKSAMQMGKTPHADIKAAIKADFLGAK